MHDAVKLIQVPKVSLSILNLVGDVWRFGKIRLSYRRSDKTSVFTKTDRVFLLKLPYLMF